MFQRIKKAWALSKQPNALYLDASKITEEQLKIIEQDPSAVIKVPREALGDGGAVFIGEGSHEEFLEFEKEEQGMKPWYERLKNLM